jgi:hypothetical protein
VHVQALQVLVLRKRTLVGDGLMQQMAQQQATWALRELDISLTVRRMDWDLILPCHLPKT